ncbi:MAG: hypothetical protein ACM3X0_06005 [Bacteroidota bacterium]
MKSRWQQLDKKYAALSLRERALVAVAALAFIGYVGNALWVMPVFARSQQFARLTAQQEKELSALQAQLTTLQTQVAIDPNAPLQAKLGEVRAQTADLDSRMKAFEAALVPPERMAAVLDNLLRQTRGVRLVSLKTLPIEPLIQVSTTEGGSIAPRANMYKHGFELRIEGAYLDLTAYLAELERQPQQMLWQRAVLVVGEYPKSTLTVTFFSLSLDKDWLSL